MCRSHELLVLADDAMRAGKPIPFDFSRGPDRTVRDDGDDLDAAHRTLGTFDHLG